MTAPASTETADDLYRLLFAVMFPETVEGYDPLEARLATIDQMLGEVTDMEIVNDLQEQKAEILIQLERM